MGQENIRQEAIKQFAYRLGGVFSEGDGPGIFPLVRDLPLFRRGIRKEITNVVSLEADWGKIHLFDYKNTRSRGNHFKRFRRSVVFINARQLGLPEFRVRPARIIDKLIGLMSTVGIPFEENRYFNKRYIVQSDDASMTRHYLRENVQDFMAQRKDWHVEGLGFYMVLYGAPRLAEGRELGRLLEESLQIAKLMMGNRYEAGWFLKQGK